MLLNSLLCWLEGLVVEVDSGSQVEGDVEIEEGVLVGRVVSVSRQHRHTLEHTGLMRWESSLPLARFLLALPALIQGLILAQTPPSPLPLCHAHVLTHGISGP